MALRFVPPHDNFIPWQEIRDAHERSEESRAADRAAEQAEAETRWTAKHGEGWQAHKAVPMDPQPGHPSWTAYRPRRAGERGTREK